MKSKKILLAVIIAAVVAVAAAVTTIVVVTSSKKSAEYALNANGGTVSETTVKVDDGANYTLPTPTRDGYVFDGWFSDEAYTTPFASSGVAAEGSYTLYAKWIKVYTVTLNANGGSLSTSSVTAKDGEVIYDAISAYVPTKSGYQFGAWTTADGNELGKNTRLTSDITLTAKYKMAYRVEVYEQNKTLDGYELSEVSSETLYAYEGERVTSDKKLVGFTLAENADAVTSLTLKEGENNVLKLYFDREVFRVGFVSNYPEDGEEEIKYVDVLFGDEVEVNANFECEGYILVGWAMSATGNIVYQSNYISDRLYNGDGSANENKFVPTRDTNLYAVWQKGYMDMFGGNDFLYLIDETSEVIYLERGGFFFQGEYDPENRSFTFRDVNDDILLYGKLKSDSTYLYSDAERANTDASLYTMNGSLNDNVKILFGRSDEIEYSEKDENGIVHSSNGTYTINENGQYVAEFTSGEKAGQTMIMLVSTVTVGGTRTPAFMLRNEEEYNMGVISRLGLNGSSIARASAYNLLLTGFGIAYINTGNGVNSYHYSYDSENKVLTLNTSSGSTAGIFKIVEVELNNETVTGYLPYTAAMAHTYENENEKLTLDGTVYATYENKNGVKTNGYYSVAASALGGNLVTFYHGDETYKFYVNAVTETITTEIEGEGGETETKTENVVNYTLAQKNTKYAEYYYMNGEGIYYAPLLVFNDGEENEVLIYGRTTTRTYVLFGKGVVTADGDKNLLTITEKYDVEVSTTPIDVYLLKSFVYVLDTSSTSYSVHYWYSYTTDEGTEELSTVYTADNGDKLTLVSGIAIIDGNEQTVGTYTLSETGLVTVKAGDHTFYFEVSEDKKFLTLDSAPYTSYGVNADGTVNRQERMSFDGKGGAAYVAGQDIESVNGKVVRTEETTFSGSYIFTFTADDDSISFNFIQIATSNTSYIAKYNEEYHGEYVSKDGILTLDGYGYRANYKDTDGEDHESFYVINDGVIRLTVDERYRFFDVKENKSFTLRGEEYATYIYFDNQDVTGYLSLDGYGHFQLFTLDDEGEKVFIEENVDDKATYVMEGDGFITLNFSDGERKDYGKLGTFTYSGTTYNTFAVAYTDVVKTYVNEKDWSTLILDSVGNAIKYDKSGRKTEGTYTLITDNLLYFADNDQTEACIYVYDVETGSATPKTFKAKSYYTESLQSLQFSSTGVARFNEDGTAVIYYYNMVNGEAVIYRRAEEGEVDNGYGFIAENFGEFTETKNYNGRKYIINTGLGIGFTRVGEVDDYRLPWKANSDGEQTYAKIKDIKFTPNGSDFEVSGTMLIETPDVDENGKPVNVSRTCTFVREVKEDGTFEMYVKLYLSSYVYYRFDLSLSYKGVNEEDESLSEYEIRGMKRIINVSSYNYQYIYSMYSMIFGASFAATIPNSYGTIELVYVYGTDSEEMSRYISPKFGEAYNGIVDYNGDEVSFDGMSFELENNAIDLETVGKDGNTYRLHISIRSAGSGIGFTLAAFTRVQEFNVNGYTVEIERIMLSESAAPGALYNIKLSKGGEAINANNIVRIGDSWYYIVRTQNDEKKFVSATYYKLDLEEEEDDGTVDGKETADGEEGEEGEEVQNTKIPLYKSVKLATFEVDTYYSDDGNTYVDIGKDGKVYYIRQSGSWFAATETEYDSVADVYTIKGSNGNSYTLKIENGKAVLELIPEEEEEA